MSAALPPAAAVAAVLLAAGRSARMGELKPLLPFGGSTVLGHVVGVLRAGGVGDVVVVTGHEGEAVAAEARRHGAAVAPNRRYAEGMLSSVRAGLAVLPEGAEAALLLPADMPLIRPATIARIAALAGSAPLTHPTFRGRRGHPPLIGRALFAEIAEGDGRLSDILRRHADAAVLLPVFDRGVVTDMDEPGDHAALSAALAGHVHPDAEECEAILDFAGTAEATVRHCRAVAALATEIAVRLAGAGIDLDPGLVAAAGHLHDVAKAEPDHPAAGARLLSSLGFDAEAEVVARHMWLPDEVPPLSEAAIVYLADKQVAGERRVGLEARFAAAYARHAGDDVALAGLARRQARARAVRAAVEARIGDLAPLLG